MTRLLPTEIRSEHLVRPVPFDDVESARRGPIRGGIEVPDLDDRVTKLEERSDAHTRTMDYLRAEMSDLRGEMHALSGELRSEMSDLHGEMRALAGELRSEMSDLHGEMRALAGELRSEMSDLRGGLHTLAGDLRNEMHLLHTEMRLDFADLRTTMDRRFTWLTGILVAGLVGVIGALVGAR